MTSKPRTIRKIAQIAFQGLFFLASCLLLPASSSAQSPVNVTATVKDSAGIPYSNATVSILLIPTGTAPTVGGAQISGTNNGQLDVNGKLNVSLYKNTDIVPASSQWQFTICETPGVAPPLGTGGQCFTSSQTVSAAVDFSTQFQAAAKSLTTVTVGGAGSVTHTGGALTANLPVIGAGGADIAVGTRTGNTTLFPTFTGAATAARCIDTDASGNLQVASADCPTGPSLAALPTTPNGVSFIDTSTPAGGVGVVPAWSWPGVSVNAQTGTTYPTFAATDRGSILTFSNVGAIAVTPPALGSTNFANSFNFGACNINTGLVTFTPTTSTWNGAASGIMPNHWCSYAYTDPVNNYRVGTFADIAAYPNCVDSAGNHLNFTASTGAFSCGTSSSSSGALVQVPATTAANTVAPTTDIVGVTVLQTTAGAPASDIFDVCTNVAGACGSKILKVASNQGVAVASGFNVGANAIGLDTNQFTDYIAANETSSLTHNLPDMGGTFIIRQTTPIHLTAQTAAISTATLCAATAGNCNKAGNYTVEWAFTQTGTACGTPGAGGVTFLLTWTDQNGTAHSATSLAMDDSASLVATTGTFHFTTSNATAWASGQFNISSNGSIIQYATGYTACGVGTGSYQIDAWVTRTL